MTLLLANASRVAQFFCADAAVATLTAALLPITAVNTIGGWVGGLLDHLWLAGLGPGDWAAGCRPHAPPSVFDWGTCTCSMSTSPPPGAPHPCGLSSQRAAGHSATLSPSPARLHV